MTSFSLPLVLHVQADDQNEAREQCLCRGEGPDRFGNYDHVVNPNCPLCAPGGTQ